MRDAHVQNPRHPDRMSRSALALLPHIMRTASQVLTTDSKIVDYETNIFNDSFNTLFLVNHGCFVADGLAGFISLCWRNFNGFFFPRYAGGCFVLTRGVAGCAISAFAGWSHILFYRDASQWLPSAAIPHVCA